MNPDLLQATRELSKKPWLSGVSRMDRKGAKRFIRQFKQPMVITSVEVAKAVRHRESVMGKMSLEKYKMVLDLEMYARDDLKESQ